MGKHHSPDVSGDRQRRDRQYRGQLATWAALVCAVALLMICGLAPQPAWGASPGPGIDAVAEFEGASVDGSPDNRGSLPDHESPIQETPGDTDDDLEDEREFELAIPPVVGPVTGRMSLADCSPAHLLSPKTRAIDTLEKPPRA